MCMSCYVTASQKTEYVYMAVLMHGKELQDILVCVSVLSPETIKERYVVVVVVCE